VQVINLVCEKSIEHRMLGLLAEKQRLADGVLDGVGDLQAMEIPSGRGALIQRLEELMTLDLRQTFRQERRSQPPKSRPPTEDPLQVFSTDAVARLTEQLLVVESRAGTSGSPSILAVVDGPRERFLPILQKSLQGSFAGQAAKPKLEILDRTTFETIQRLIAAGHLQPGSESVRRLYESPTLRASSSDQAARYAEARKIFEQGDRKSKMSELLRDNGFVTEALPPLKEAAAISLQALACLFEMRLPEKEQLFEPSNLRRLVSPLGLEEGFVTSLSQFGTEIGSPADTPEATEDLFMAARHLSDRLDEQLNQAALTAG
jgi:hypothetical protein